MTKIVLPDFKRPKPIDTHPMPGAWFWWGSTDGGEHMTIGPCDTPEQVIDEAKDQDHEHVTVAYCKENHVDLANWLDFDWMMEEMREAMDEDGSGSDECGDRHPLDDISREQRADLELTIKRAIRGWQQHHQLKLRSYWFKETMHEREVEISKNHEG